MICYTDSKPKYVPTSSQSLIKISIENFSSFNRVVGKVSEQEKEEILRHKSERFNDQSFMDLAGKEREKTQEELLILTLVNDATNTLLHTYGLPSFDIPPQNIHVIRESQWPTNRGTGFYNAMIQAVAMREESARLVFMNKSIHEILHFKSYGALQITTEDDPQEHEYRLGLTVTKRDGSQILFRNLNEAVTEELTKRVFFTLSSNPIFSAETQQTSQLARKEKGALSIDGEPLFDNETYYGEIESLSEGRARVNTQSFTKKQERRILNTLLRKLQERSQGKFKDQEGLFELFASSMLTGNIMTLGKLIDRTFGKGTFKKIGELDDEIDEQEAYVNSL